jgi:hypothetical protein
MGLVAAIFTYLCSVAVLVVALLIPLGAFLYPPGQTKVAQQTIAATAKPRTAPAATATAAGNERSGSPGAKEASADISSSVPPQPHVRRLVRQVRAKDWLLQKEMRVFGYVEEPSASFLYDRFQ